MEVAWNLVDIFLFLGAPHILQSDNGREFTAEMVSELKEIWPDLLLVHGKPRHPQSQGSVERCNGDIKDPNLVAERQQLNRLDSWLKVRPVHEKHQLSLRQQSDTI